jgi:pimeloyl-ACP methyl ester carboxylesterase
MKLFFRKSGEGKPLVILHGLFGMNDNWMTLSKQFVEKGYAVYAVDLRNHGRSPRSNEFSFEVMSEDVAQLIMDENIAPAVLLGHSLGAKVAMWLACSQPRLVEALIATDMAPVYYAPHHQSVFAAIHAVDLGSSTRKDAEARLRETLRDEGTVQFLLKNLYWDESRKLNWRFNLDAIEQNVDSIGIALPADFRFEGNTLFVRGEKSGYITEEHRSVIQLHFPKAVIKTVPDAGHWVHAENPEGCMKEVLEFLSGL